MYNLSKYSIRLDGNGELTDDLLIFLKQLVAEAQKKLIKTQYDLAIQEVNKLMRISGTKLKPACKQVCELEKFKDLNVETLRSRLRTASTSPKAKLYPSLLNSSQQQFLVDLIISFSTLATALTRLQVRKFAQLIIGAEELPSKHWVSDFLKKTSKKYQQGFQREVTRNSSCFLPMQP